MRKRNRQCLMSLILTEINGNCHPMFPEERFPEERFPEEQLPEEHERTIAMPAAFDDIICCNRHHPRLITKEILHAQAALHPCDFDCASGFPGSSPGTTSRASAAQTTPVPDVEGHFAHRHGVSGGVHPPGR